MSIVSHAQYTGVINANNPGFAESPYSVGLGVYQFESNLFRRNTSTEPTFSTPDAFGFNIQYRMSYFFEELEFQANLGLQRDQIAFRNGFSSSFRNQTSLSALSFGAKYLLYERPFKDKSKEIRSWKKRHAFDWNRLIPSVAVFGGFNTNLVGEVHQRQSMTGRLGILLQNDINNKLNVVTNAFYDYIGSNQAELSLVISSTYSVTDRWSTFFEYQNIFREFINDVNFGTGLAFLYHRNLQINGSLRYLIEGEAAGYYASVGVSYRLDRHIDSEILYDDVGNVVRKKKDELEQLQDKKGIAKFFNDINIFKKSVGKKKANLNDRTIKSIENNINVDDETLYQQRKKLGLPVRTRPKRVRAKPSKVKPIKTKKGESTKVDAKGDKDDAKADKQLLKEKEKEDKQKAKARRRAEKEADRILKREAKAKAKAKKEAEKKKKKEKEEENQENGGR